MDASFCGISWAAGGDGCRDSLGWIDSQINQSFHSLLLLCLSSAVLPLHPAVRKGVVLAVPVKLVESCVGVQPFDWGPHALLMKADDLQGPPA